MRVEIFLKCDHSDFSACLLGTKIWVMLIKRATAYKALFSWSQVVSVYIFIFWSHLTLKVCTATENRKKNYYKVI